MDLIKALTVAASALAASSTLGYSLWSIGDYTGLRPVLKNEWMLQQQEQTEQAISSVLFVRFLYLLDKRKFHSIAQDELPELCGLSKKLKITINDPTCPLN